MIKLLINNFIKLDSIKTDNFITINKQYNCNIRNII